MSVPLAAGPRRFSSCVRSCAAHRFVLATCASALLLLASPAGAQQRPWTLRVQPVRVSQGGIVFVSLATKEAIRDATCEWLGQKYSMFQAADGYRAALPVDRLQKTGPAPLVVRAAGFEEPLAVRTLQIAALNTGPVQTVRLTPEVMKAEQDPRIAEDQKRSRQILATQTAAALWQGGFRPPVGVAGRNFGRQRHYVEVVNNGKPAASFDGYHRGLDFPVGPGTRVRAAADGVVIATERFVLSGNSVFVDHGQGIITAYFHLSEFRVKPGEKVERGEVVGLSGSTGRSTGPHLHWAVYAQGRSVNPLAILQLPVFFRIQ